MAAVVLAALGVYVAVQLGRWLAAPAPPLCACYCAETPLSVRCRRLRRRAGEFLLRPDPESHSALVGSAGQVAGWAVGGAALRLPGDAPHYELQKARFRAMGCARGRRECTTRPP